MKIAILFVACLFTLTATAYSQDTCKVFGQRNPHGVAMEIKAPFYIVDSVNFRAESVRPLPFNIGATDTIFFHVCLVANDGLKHSTQIRYNSTHGMVSYNITMQAPKSAVSTDPTAGDIVSLPYPNPAARSVSFDVAPGLTDGVMKIYSTAGTLVAIYPVAATKVELPVSSLPTGSYVARLQSHGQTQAERVFTVSH